jgi:hypothetical protein
LLDRFWRVFQGEYGHSRNSEKRDITCRKCCYLEGLTVETAKAVCKACDDFKQTGSQRHSSGPPQFTEEEQLRLLLES